MFLFCCLGKKRVQEVKHRAPRWCCQAPRPSHVPCLFLSSCSLLCVWKGAEGETSLPRPRDGSALRGWALSGTEHTGRAGGPEACSESFSVSPQHSERGVSRSWDAIRASCPPQVEAEVRCVSGKPQAREALCLGTAEDAGFHPIPSHLGCSALCPQPHCRAALGCE